MNFVVTDTGQAYQTLFHKTLKWNDISALTEFSYSSYSPACFHTSICSKLKSTRDYSFSTCVKNPERITFLIPWYALIRYLRKKC